MINTSVDAVCKSLTMLSQLSEVDKFYWHFIASCCINAQPNLENLTKLNTYIFVIQKLSKIYHEYCTVRKIQKSVIHTIPQEISHISNTDVKDYFKWVIKMQNIMIHWQSKFIEQDFNYNDILMYDENLQSITTFAKAVCTEHLLYNVEDIARFKEDHSKAFASLCSLLVIDNKDNGW